MNASLARSSFRLVSVAASVLLAAACSSSPSSTGTESSANAGEAPRAAGAPAPRPAVRARPMPDLTKQHPFCVHDMVRMERVGDPIPSPDGLWICFTRQSWDPDTNQKTSNLWLVSTDGATTKQLTSAKGVADNSPVWASDGKSVLFLSSRGGSSQVWTIRVDGGEPRQLSTLPVDVDNLRMSPIGAHLAFSADVYPELASLDETAKRDAERAKDPVKALAFERLMVRHWDQWFDGKRRHLFVMPLQSKDGDVSIAGAPLDLMKGVDADCPTQPFGGTEDFAFAPDGKEITYVAQLGDNVAWSTNTDLFVVPVAGGPARCLTESNKASDHAPVYSPDGGTIAYLAMARPGFESDRNVVWLLDRKSGQTRPLTASWDRSASSLLYSPNGKVLYCIAEEEARQRVFAVDVASGATLPVLREHSSHALEIVPAHEKSPPRLALLQASFQAPAEILRCDLEGFNRQRLTRVNDARVALTQTSDPEEFTFQGANGDKVQAWLLKPVGFEAGKKYPLAFVIHGGPQGAILDAFHYRWNLEAFAGAGFGVVAVNFHGSTGFGQAFTDSISGDWGGKPFEDLMLGLDAALKQCHWIDGDRCAALGASYGGWMINWVNGHTDRFKCLVCHDGIFDTRGAYFATEELWFPEWEFGGVPWLKPELYEKFSPSRSLQQWKTPTLVIHGAKDYRLPDVEGLAAFTALQRRGVPAKLLWFPDENHWVMKNRNSIRWHETVIEWLDRWLAPPSAATTSP